MKIIPIIAYKILILRKTLMCQVKINRILHYINNSSDESCINIIVIKFPSLKLFTINISNFTTIFLQPHYLIVIPLLRFKSSGKRSPSFHSNLFAAISKKNIPSSEGNPHIIFLCPNVRITFGYCIIHIKRYEIM